jgi:hypothetical protein
MLARPKNKKYDKGSLYWSFMAAVCIWTVTVCMHMFGIAVGLIYGLPAGSLAVLALDTTVGFLYNSGY